MGNSVVGNKERFSLGLLLPRYLFIGQLALMGGLGIVIIGVIGAMRHGNVLPNVFAPYADVFPGQSIRTLDSDGFVCTVRDYVFANDLPETRCALSPTSGTFTRIEAFYASGVIHRLSFEIRENALAIGEIAVMLETSEIYPQQYIEFNYPQQHVVFNWHRNIVIAQVANPSAHFSVLNTVAQVTLTDSELRMP